jgi:hypothetical protein
MYDKLDGFLKAVLATLTAISIGLAIIAHIKKILDKHPGWKLTLLILTAVLLSLTVISFFLSPPPNPCSLNSMPLIFKDDLSNDSFHYLNLPGYPKSLISVSQTDKLRLRALEEAFSRGDSDMKTHNLLPYGDSILPYFVKKDLLSAKIVERLRDQLFLYIKESIDSATCSYTLSLSMDKVKNREIMDFIQGIKDTICLQTAIDQLVTRPLQRDGRVSVSLCQIYNFICENCPNSKAAREWRENPSNRDGYCDSVYFDKGEYKLSLNSMVLLRLLMNSLIKLNIGPLSIQFHGYCDPSAVGKIPYSGSGYRADTGVLLSGDSLTARALGDNLTSNDDLSFARSFSCLEYVRHDFGDRQIHLSFTGHGVSQSNQPWQQKRVVSITIIKEK